MPITGNVSEIIAKMEARKAKLDGAIQQAAMQMGVECKNISLPLTRVDTGNWRDSIQPEVEQQGPGVWELTFGSPGAFTKDNVDYGAIREYLDGTIATSWFLAQPYFQSRWQQLGDELAND